MKKWTVYSVITEDMTQAYKMLIPAPDAKTAKEYAQGNGDLVSCKETDWTIDVGYLADCLARNHYGQAEIDIITRVLYQVGLDR